jgi:predicted kinase
VAQLVHLNGPPGIGKSTLSALYADRHPGTLNLDVDAVHQLIGGWADEDNRTWEVVAPLVRAMAATQLDGGRDVVVPQYHAAVEEITALEDVTREHGAAFREVVLLDDRTAAIKRFDRRARDDDDPYIQHMHRHVGLRGGAVRLGAMYDDLLELLRRHPGATVVPSTAGAVEETYALLTRALHGPDG